MYDVRKIFGFLNPLSLSLSSSCNLPVPVDRSPTMRTSYVHAPLGRMGGWIDGQSERQTAMQQLAASTAITPRIARNLSVEREEGTREKSRVTESTFLCPLFLP